MARGIGGLATLYIQRRTERGELAPTTAASARKVLWSFVQSVGYERDASRLTRRHIERWLEAQDWSPGTRRTNVSHLRCFVRWLLTEGYLKRDPFIGMATPRQPSYMPRGLSLAQAQAVAARVPDARGRLMVSLMVQEGLRCGEVSRLELGDVDFENRLILVRGKGGHQRVLPLSDETRFVMLRYLDEEPARHGPFFRSRVDPTRGIAPDYVSDLVREAMRAAGVNATPHALRHTAATDMLRAGAHVRDVQAALGHRELSTTQRYLPWLVGDLREAMGGRNYRSRPLTEPSATTADRIVAGEA